MENAIVKSDATEEKTLSAYIRRPDIIEKFALVLGNDREAKRYVQSVVLVVETAEPGDYSLQNCTLRSIVRAALRAAVQRVSVDPIDREAYLIPRNITRVVNGREQKVQEACFQFHYQEILNRALRTNRYKVINVSPIYEGTEIYENVYTGLHTLKLENGLMVANESAPVLRKWGESDGKKRIGWLGYYRTTFGMEKTIYMTIADIEKQVHKAPGGGAGFGWSKFRDTMEMKTVLLALLRKADLKSIEMAAVKNALDSIDNAENGEEDGGPDLEKLDALEGEATDIPVTVTESPKQTEAELMGDMGFEPEPIVPPAPKVEEKQIKQAMTIEMAKKFKTGTGGFYENCKDDYLNMILSQERFTPEQKLAASMVLASRKPADRLL